MFKKFNPKEDIASSTSLKSSSQRHIRTSLLEQIPFLSLRTHDSPVPATPAPAPVSADAQGEENDAAVEVVEEETSKGKGKGGKKKGGDGGKGKKGKKGGKEEEEEKKDGEGEGVQEVLVIDEIWPKKEALAITKCRDHLTIYTLNSEPLIFQHFDGPLCPVLKLLHKYPEMLPRVQVDRGAIKFLLAGANMMSPGLLSPGGHLPPSLPANTLVAIHAEGKEHAAGIGKLLVGSEEIRRVGKGVAVEVYCYVGDDLWKVDKL